MQASTPTAAPPAAILLAAGLSRRAAPFNKLLRPIPGAPMTPDAPMIAVVVDRFLATAARPVVVVVGHDAAAVIDALADRPVAFAVNPAPEDGVSGSIRAALDALPPAAPAALIGLGDMPLVSSAVIARLLDVRAADPNALIVAPSHRGRRGHPVLWDRRFFPALRALTGDRGGRGLIKAHPDAVRLVPVEDPGVVTDFDAAEDFESLRASRQDFCRHGSREGEP